MFRFCNISPNEFWDYTEAETEQMLEVGYLKFEFEQENEAWKLANILAAVLNAPHYKQRSEKPYTVEQFVPAEYLKGSKKRNKKSVVEGAKAWVASFAQK